MPVFFIKIYNEKNFGSITFSFGHNRIFSCRSKNSLPTAPGAKSLLWEISGNGLQKPSYFFGTMHLMCAEDAELSTNLKELIKNIDQVYLEVDMDNAGELLTGLLDMSSKPGHKLSDFLSDTDYDKIKSFFSKVQPEVPFSAFESQPPLMISASLYEFLLPCDKKNGVDIKIIDEAYKAKKETKGLETIEFQAAIFDSIPYSEQAKDLVNAIDSIEKYRISMSEMLQVYKNQDIEKLYTLSLNDESIAGSYMDILLFNRNRTWVDKFPSVAKDSSTLFAVGAGHLGGEKGVLALLRQKGFTVRPIMN